MSDDFPTGDNPDLVGYFKPQISAANLKCLSRIVLNVRPMLFFLRKESAMATLTRSGRLAPMWCSSWSNVGFGPSLSLCSRIQSLSVPLRGLNSFLDQSSISRFCEYRDSKTKDHVREEIVHNLVLPSWSFRADSSLLYTHPPKQRIHRDRRT